MNEKVQGPDLGSRGQTGTTKPETAAKPETVTVTRPERVTVTNPETVTTKPEEKPETAAKPEGRAAQPETAGREDQLSETAGREDQRPAEDPEGARGSEAGAARALLPEDGEDRSVGLAGPKGSTAATYGTGHKAHVESEGLTPAPGLPAGIG